MYGFLFSGNDASKVVDGAGGMAILLGSYGAIGVAPVALPIIALFAWGNALRFWNCVVGGGICGAIAMMIVARHSNDAALLMLKGAGLGLFPGFVFASVLKATGYFKEQVPGYNAH